MWNVECGVEEGEALSLIMSEESETGSSRPRVRRSENTEFRTQNFSQSPQIQDTTKQMMIAMMGIEKSEMA